MIGIFRACSTCWISSRSASRGWIDRHSTWVAMWSSCISQGTRLWRNVRIPSRELRPLTPARPLCQCYRLKHRRFCSWQLESSWRLWKGSKSLQRDLELKLSNCDLKRKGLSDSQVVNCRSSPSWPLLHSKRFMLIIKSKRRRPVWLFPSVCWPFLLRCLMSNVKVLLVKRSWAMWI